MKVLCKKTFSLKISNIKQIELYTENKWYPIVDSYEDTFKIPGGFKGSKLQSYEIETNHPNIYDNIWFSITTPEFPPTDKYKEYFYTKQELRQLKLNKLKKYENIP